MIFQYCLSGEGCVLFRRILDNSFISTGMETRRNEFEVTTREFISLRIKYWNRLEEFVVLGLMHLYRRICGSRAYAFIHLWEMGMKQKR